MKKIVLGLALAAAVASACSTSDPVAQADADVVNVKLANQEFTPATVTIKVGQTVRWTWAGGEHNVVSGPDCNAPDGVFKSGAPQQGGTFDKKFETAGSFKYYCEPHCTMGMKGEIVVE